MLTKRSLAQVFTFTLTSFLVFASCAKNRPALAPELKQEISVSPTKIAAQKIAMHQMLGSTQSTQRTVTEVKVQKAALLGRTFLYGASLQFGSELSDGEAVAQMAVVLGQVPAEFVIVDNRLRLMLDSRANFASDINHPSRLIQEFPILSEDAEFITFRADQASPVLETYLLGQSSNVQKRASWIRSLEFSAPEELFLIQSSIELKNGTLAEFLETLTPRERQVPADTKPIYDDAELNPLADRFEFLNGGKLYLNHAEKGRVQTQVADRFLVRAGEPIRWYVTRNIPEKFIGDVKAGVEGWNRYTRAAGTPDLLRFEGLLPEGVAVGDPRYNIIVWDNVPEADSAYESQMSDPFTGVQSHSLIYLPMAWVEIGKNYWEGMSGTEGKFSERADQFEKSIRNKNFLGRQVPLRCLSRAHEHMHPKALENPEEFGRSLLKTTLFHEVGHALGLDHNFKGSLSFDPDSPGSSHTTSIMDYNLFNEDDASFSSLESADGPLLEYDRQIFSVLYNDGKDLRDTDPVLPSCEDEEADSTTEGIDPLCLRYDIGKDPTRTALRSLELLGKRDARLGRMSSLPAALPRLATKLADPSTIASLDDAKTSAQKFGKSAKALVLAYVGGGNGILNLTRQSLKSLYTFEADILPADLNETEMRERSLSLLETLSRTNAFPEATTTELSILRTSVSNWLLRTPAFSALPEGERSQRLGEALKPFDEELKGLAESSFSKLRIRIASSLAYRATAPLSFHVRQGQSTDLEQVVVKILEGFTSSKLEGQSRPLSERSEALKTLLSYKGGAEGKAALGRVKEALSVEINGSQNAVTREALRKMLASLE